ncbi:hypothetical protein GYB22_12215, partial [bacterium]|nr:hypothetical protein [bacterium]
MRRVFLKFSLIFWWIGLLPLIAIGQNKVAISISNPSNMDVCLESEYLEIEVRNITTSTVTGIETEVELPTAVTYVSGSLNTSGASEQNISNLSKPVFSLPSIGIASAVTLRIKIVADCDVINFLNGGGLAVIKTTTTYSGGSTSKNSNPLSIRQPSLQISNITNRFVTTDLGSVVVRQITVRNVGSGRLGELTLRRITQSGVEFIGSNRNTTISTNGDTIRTKLDSNQFNGTYIGNSDNYLDYNEAVTTTDTIKVLSCSNLVVYYTASWGCFGSTCDQFNASTNVTISTRSPRLLFTPTSNTSACMSGSNQHDQEIVIYNAGDDSARAVELDVFQSVNTGYYIYQVSEILVSTFTYQKGRNAGTVTITPSKTNPTYNQGVYSCLSSNPRGRALLELPSMAPGDSLIVKWQTQSCCPQVCNSGFYAQRWKFASTYKDQCENTISSGEYWGSTGFYQRMDFSQSTPTDISDGQTRTFEYNVTNGTLMSPSSSSLFQIELILPDGISHSLNASEIQFTHPNGGSWTPDYVYQSNDTVIAGFQGAPSMNLTRSDLLIKLTGDCSNSSANSNLDYSMNIRYNPDTTCANSCFIPVYCITSTIRLHCQPSCAAGLHFNGFEAQRISYGLPDNNNDGIPDASGAIDLDKIKTDRLMYGDTLLTTFRSKVYSAGSINQWYNGEASTVMDYGRYLSVADVRIKIYRNGNLLFNCNNIDYNYSTAGYYRTFTFDIGYNNLVNSGCSLYSSFAYLSVDSIELEVKYVVDENPGNFTRDLNFTNDFYLETNTGQRYQCDSFYGRMKLIGSYFTNYGRGVYTGAGCGNLNVSQNFYLSIGNCCTNYAGGNMFPYEYRAWAKLDKILLHLPTGFDYVSSRMYMYRTAGTSVTDYDYFSSLSPDTIQNGIAIFDAGKLYEDQSGSVPISDDGFYGIFLPTLRANCEATQGNKNIRYDFVFEKLGNLGSGYDTLQSGANDDVVQYNRPILSIIPEQKEVYAQSDTVEWNIRVTNSSTSADAEYVWIGANNTSNVKLVEVINRSTGVAVPRTNDIFKLGLIAKSAIKDYTIRAVYQNCDPDSIEILLGYDCRFYPDSVSAYDCSREKAFLSYIPINTRLEADIVGTLDSVYLCEDKAYTVLIRNTGNPKVFNAYLDVLVRPGMVLNDTAWLFIKGSSDSTMILNPVAQNGNTYRWELASQDSTLANEGLQGASSGVGSEVYLRMKISTNCDFVSGSFFMLKPGGYLKCGKAVNAAFDIGDPIDIVGVTRPYYSAISFDINHLDVCNYVDETKVKFINLGPDTTGLTDQVIISFPRGLIADTTYISSKHNAPTDYPDFEVVNGENVFTWDIPSGITPGDSMVFDLKTIIQNEALDCGTKQIFTQAVVSQPVMCIKDSTYCNIKVATSSALTSDSVEKGIYQLDFVSATSVPNGSLEDVDLYYEIENSGSAKFTGSPLNVDFYYDANNNNIVDSGDTRIATDTVYEALLSGNVVTRNFNFSLASDRSCQVLIYISDSSCVCAPVTEKVDVIQLKNAGKDTLICPNVEIQIGEPGNSQNSYSWNNQEFVSNPDSSITGFTGVNLKNVKDTAI